MSLLINKISKLKGKSIHTILHKIFQKLYDKFYYKMRKIMVYRKMLNVEAELFRGFKPSGTSLFDSKDSDYYVEKIKLLSAETTIIEDAELICCHVFNLLGSGEKELGKKIPWNEDFKSGFIWENEFYRDIKIIDLNNNADVKVPWELSRFQHINTLGKAYWITKDARYAKEFQNQIIDWIEKNPVELSVNWACTMDVAIRAVNWIEGYQFFKDCKEIGQEFWVIFHKSIYQHGKFIFNNLENKGDYTGNHYLSNIVGLIWIGIYFGSFKTSNLLDRNIPRRWLDFGLQEIEKEMQVQVNPDGTNYEASTSYHRLVTELFLLTTILCDKNKISFSNEYMERLEKMCEFIMYLTQSNGKSPLIGDADDGRLIIFSKYYSWDKSDFRHLLAVAGEFFKRNDFRYHGEAYKEDALWTNGQWTEIQHNNKPVVQSKAFEDGGYYLLKNQQFHCFIRSGELSFRGEGVHSHNDQLSFTLNVAGEDIFIDPGSFIYTADYKMRNLFRSTCMHNTMEISGCEQNDFEVHNLFRMKEQTFSKCISFSENNFVGNHRGYLEKNGGIHERSFLLSKDKLKIIDTLLVDNRFVPYKLNFVLDPDSIVSCNNNKINIIKNDVNLIVEIIGDAVIALENIYVSGGYGRKRKSKKIVVESSSQSIETYIY
ncbi:alginate lyase family protein [Bacillus thuringiensis]|nr:alginate lyase family protein [Bacillus thuringiensis]MED2807232.1 alginate lyase family protein [Bacillus thuringiensis]MED2825595.1 alginate lyase family protein [Bacillus thuringiensis]MED2831687.1 alginate lyase family protein [Bacillus thuringiensis]MED2847671.1 alginate lyase family protein [Bacillus thuringiensis]